MKLTLQDQSPQHDTRRPRSVGRAGCCLLIALLCVTAQLRADLVNYTYDTAGRLSSADYGNGRKIYYTYDASGSLTSKAVVIITDTDGDGMDDAWELAHFFTLARDGTGDFDNDGMNDLAEFLAGTNPASASSFLRFTSITTTGGITFTVEWSAAPGKNYRVQFKNSLIDAQWTDLVGDVVAAGATASKVDTTGGESTLRFYRVILLP